MKSCWCLSLSYTMLQIPTLSPAFACAIKSPWKQLLHKSNTLGVAIPTLDIYSINKTKQNKDKMCKDTYIIE